MRIGFFTEAGYQGTPPRDTQNMRTDLSWVCALNAVHHPIQTINQLPDNSYDIGICIIPKKRTHLHSIDLSKELKRVCGKIVNMQEGCHWEWMDDEIEDQIWWFNQVVEMDMILCHNDADVKYFGGITSRPSQLFQTLMITDLLTETLPKKDAVMIHGNWCMLNRGFDSYMVATEFGKWDRASTEIHAPSMGRKIEFEDQMENLIHLPYMNWVDWVNHLSQFKYVVHLMPTHAAGTFAMNCAYWGIPCIGYDGLDTQQILHPKCSVSNGNLDLAREVAMRLANNSEFYKECSEDTIEKYKKYFDESVYVNNMEKIIEGVMLNE